MPDAPNFETLSLSAPALSGNEWRYVNECLDSGWLSHSGSFVTEFEKSLAERLGAGFATCVVNGTAALHLAFHILGVSINDEVIMPALGFVAPANAVRYLGAWPTLIDIQSDSWQLDVDQLEEFLETAEARQGELINRFTGRRIAAICVVHLLGSMADLDEALRVAARFGLPVVEDAAECLGARYRGREIGSACPDFDEVRRIIITSFNANKIITSGGGGALFTHDPAIGNRARHLATTAKRDVVEFEHDQVGYNYRLGNVLAAIGLAQLEQLDVRLRVRQELVVQYRSALAPIRNLSEMPIPAYVRPNNWLHTIAVPGGSRPLLARLSECGVETRPPWRPISRQSYLSPCGGRRDRAAGARRGPLSTIGCRHRAG
jgi:perosamine synthetase